MSNTMTIRLPDEDKQRLGKLAAATRRSRSFLAAEAIHEYIELNEWQIDEINEALSEADRGEFATDAEVTAVFDGWRPRGD